MTALLALAASLALAACGGTHPDKPTTGGDGAGSGSATDPGSGSGEGSSSGSAAATDPKAPLSQDECRVMFGHIIDISLAERHAKNPTEPAFKPEVIADLKDKQAKAGMDSCLQAPRDQFDCIMTATDSSSLGLCGE